MGSLSDRLPPEIWMRIFELACRDCGKTGRSLGLVSRNIRILSRPYAYQSIHLPHKRDLPAFRDFLSTLTANERRVKFLHLPCPNAIHHIPRSDSYEDTVPHSETQLDHVGQIDSLRAILLQVSASLCVLSIFWESNDGIVIEGLLVQLPALEELHLFRRFRRVVKDFGTTKSGPPVLFPSLRRLHISGLCDFRSMEFFDVIGRIAPSLTHLCLPIHFVRATKTRLPNSVHTVIVDLEGKATRFYPTEDCERMRKLLFGTYPAQAKSLTILEGGDSPPQGWKARWASFAEEKWQQNLRFDSWIIC